MRIIPPSLLAAALCTLWTGSVHAQTSTSTLARVSTPSARIPSGMSFTYDAQHSQINAAGVQLLPAIVTAPTVKPTTGTITVTINIKIVSSFPKSTKFGCSLMAIGGMIDTNNGTVAGGIETASKAATGSGSGYATCTLTIPYSWSLPTDSSADSGLILAFGASGLQMLADNIHSNVLRSTLQLDGIETLPANSTTSKYTFDVEL